MQETRHTKYPLSGVKCSLSHIQGIVFNQTPASEFMEQILFQPLSNFLCTVMEASESQGRSHSQCSVQFSLVSEEPAQSANSAAWKCRESVPTGANVLIPSLLWAFLGWTRAITRILKVWHTYGFPGRDPQLS